MPNMKNNKKNHFFQTLIFLCSFLFITQCGIHKKVDTRKVPINAQDRARLAVKEGRGMALGNVLKRGKTNFEFSSSNPLWRSSLEILDFLPLSVVDYSGGILITDWYANETNSKKSLKITIRFLSNEVRTDSLKVIVHEKICSSNSICSAKIVKSQISKELVTSIVKKAAVLQANQKSKKK